MNRKVNRDHVGRLLQNEFLSYRDIAREAGCSDWTVRAIARDLAGDDRPMKHDRSATGKANDFQPSTSGWAVLGIGAALLITVGIYIRASPPDT